MHQVGIEHLHILFTALAAHKLFPRREQIFNRNDTLKCMSELNSPRATSPQELFARYRTYKESLHPLAPYTTQHPSG